MPVHDKIMIFIQVSSQSTVPSEVTADIGIQYAYLAASYMHCLGIMMFSAARDGKSKYSRVSAKVKASYGESPLKNFSKVFM